MYIFAINLGQRVITRFSLSICYYKRRAYPQNYNSERTVIVLFTDVRSAQDTRSHQKLLYTGNIRFFFLTHSFSRTLHIPT